MSKYDDPMEKIRSSSALHRRLIALAIPVDEALDLLVEYEHSLAQMIRKQTARRNGIRPEFEQAWDLGLHRGADLLDPEKADDPWENDQLPTMQDAVAAVQRVEEVLDANADTGWAMLPQTQEIRAAITDIDTLDGGWEPLIG